MTDNSSSSGVNTSAEGLRDRLQFMGIDQATLESLRSLAPTLNRNLEPALDRFYSIIAAKPELRAYFADQAHMRRAKNSQIQHWHAFTAGKIDQAYITAVRRVGLTHARIGLEPRWYIAGYALLLEQLMRSVIDAQKPAGMAMLLRGNDAEALANGLVAVVKAALLDMDYSISVYIEASDDARRKEEDQRKTAEEEG